MIYGKMIQICLHSISQWSNNKNHFLYIKSYLFIGFSLLIFSLFGLLSTFYIVGIRYILHIACINYYSKTIFPSLSSSAKIFFPQIYCWRSKYLFFHLFLGVLTKIEKMNMIRIMLNIKLIKFSAFHFYLYLHIWRFLLWYSIFINYQIPMCVHIFSAFSWNDSWLLFSFNAFIWNTREKSARSFSYMWKAIINWILVWIAHELLLFVFTYLPKNLQIALFFFLFSDFYHFKIQCQYFAIFHSTLFLSNLCKTIS